MAIKHAVYLILLDDWGKLILLLRYNTGWKEGWYTVVAGHVEPGETPEAAMRREAREEIGVHLIEFHPVAIVERDGDTYYIDHFYFADSVDGKPHNAEPDKCSRMDSYSLDELPPNVLPHIVEVLKRWANGEENIQFTIPANPAT